MCMCSRAMWAGILPAIKMASESNVHWSLWCDIFTAYELWNRIVIFVFDKSKLFMKMFCLDFRRRIIFRKDDVEHAHLNL